MKESEEEQVGRKDKPIASENHAAVLLGQRLRQARQDNGITLTALAQHIGYSKTHVSWVEHRRHVPSLGIFDWLCQCRGYASWSMAPRATRCRAVRACH